MKIIITGAHAIGTYLAKLLSRSMQDIVFMDEDPENLEKISSEYDLLTMECSPTNIRGLKEAGAEHTDLFIAVTPNESANIASCVMAHQLGARKTVARMDNPEYVEEHNKELFRQMGISDIIYPEVLAAEDIINGSKISWIRQCRDVYDGVLVMLGIKLRGACEILNRPLKDICGLGDPYHVVTIKHDDETIIPGGNDTLQLYNLAYFMTTKQYIPYIHKIVGKGQYVDARNAIFMGGGKTAARAAKMLPEYMDAKIIELNPACCEVLNDAFSEDRLAINSDGRNIGLLQEEGIRHTQAFVALTSNAETNILACLTAKRLGVRKTVASIENLDYVNTADGLDIGMIIGRKALIASHIYRMMLDANVANIKFLTSINSDMAEFVPSLDSKITRKAVRELNLPRGMTIGGFVRNGEGMLVSGNALIEAGDSVVVFCYNVDMKRVEKLFT